MIAKMIVSHLILNYDFRLAEEKQPSTFTWGIASVPHPRLKVLFREKACFEQRE